jgi:predicted dehydrogenase
VVGTNWGAVHVAALREAGAEVVAMVGLDLHVTQEAADEMGVPLAADHVSALSRMDLDLITVATPAATHAHVVADLPDVPVLCEKPAVGLSPLVHLPVGRRAPVWVNYPFSFLDVAQISALQVSRIGPITSAQVVSCHDLPDLSFTPEGMFLELVPHPWSWLVAQLGSPVPPSRTIDGPTSQRGFQARCGAVDVALISEHSPGLRGIRHSVTLHGVNGSIALHGSFEIGHEWRFGPPVLELPDGSTGAIGGGEPGPGDPWYRANARSIAAVVAAISGEPASPWLFDWDTALSMDRAAQRGLLGG